MFELLDKISSKKPQPTKTSPSKVRFNTAISSAFAALLMLMIAFSIDALLVKVFFVVSFLVYGYFGYILFKRRVPKELEIIEEEEEF